jgi:hypothetical protein
MAETSPHGAAPENREKANLPPVAPPRNHGHTVAAWVAMTAVMVGATLVAVGFVVPARWLVWAGAAVVVLGLLVGGLLRKAGLGQPEPSATPRTGAGPSDTDRSKEQA